ncbi:MAG: NTP transferase domain-containing protein [Persicimonas sp.]
MYKKALIPAAGRGARLDRPNTPKPLVDVGGRPLVIRVLSQLEAVGVEQAVVVVGFEAAQIVRELTNHPDLGLEVELVEHPGWQNGQASSLLAARERFDEPFLLAMADHVFDPELVERMAETNLPEGQVARMLVDRDVEGIYDLADAVKVSLDGDQVLDAGRNLEAFDGVDAGLFAARPALFDALEAALVEHEPAGLTAAVARLAADGGVGARFVPQRQEDGPSWHDIDTPPALIRAEMEHRRRRRGDAVFQPSFIADTTAPTHHYSFETGKPTQTEVFVQRGFVREPSTLELIPEASASSPIYVFTDTRVNELYGDDFVGGMRQMGYDVRRVVMAEGEESKTLRNYTRLVEHVLAEGIDERSVLVSLGGGAVCNVCGFIASTLYRGIGLVHVPTTLMAQCDAAISHKQGVNGERGKNLVGAYYPPINIAVDVEVLATLEDWLIPDGLSEVVKHALGQDPAYLDYLLDFDGDMRDADFLEHVVRRNIELKCELMAVDPKELREGMVLQYGHTVGHPIEYLSGYDLNHGQSVGIGMMVAARVARLLGACGDEMIELHRKVIEKYELPTRIPKNIAVDDILAMMRFNKRYLTEGTRMALVDAPGHLWSVDGDYTIPVSDGVLQEAIELSY